MTESGADRLAKLLAKRGRSTPSTEPRRAPSKPRAAAEVSTTLEASALHVGDCRSVLAGLPSASIDAVITDVAAPPSSVYDGWEHQVPGPTFWTALLRVAKPGAWMAVFSSRKTDHRLKVAAEDAGWELRDSLFWVYPKGLTDSLDVGQKVDKKLGGPGLPYFRTIGSMNDAQREAFMGNTDNPWFGYGTALRPSWEPIALFRKPSNLTFADNVIEHGVGALNIDATRIDSGERDAIATHIPEGQGSAHGASLTKLQHVVGSTSLGRWPADVLFSHHVDCGQSGDGGDGDGTCAPGCPVGLMGDAAKFFYAAKTSRSEKDVGLPSKGNPAKFIKPASVIEWIAHLICPRGATVLDPFMGTGSTGMGVMAIPGSKFIGIDDDPHLVELAEKRLAAWTQQRLT